MHITRVIIIVSFSSLSAVFKRTKAKIMDRSKFVFIFNGVCHASEEKSKSCQNNLVCDLYHKHIAIINDASKVVRMTIISDAPTWSITDDCN